MMTSRLTISVILATMNRSEDLKKAIVSVLGQTRLPEEVWIIDQSTDGRTKPVYEELLSSAPAAAGRLRYVYQEQKSLVLARNRGMDLAGGDILSFLDDDVVLDADYYEKIAAEFARDPSLAGLSGNARVPSPAQGWRWALRKTLHRFFLLSGYDGRMTASGFGYPIFEAEIDRVREVDMLPGCNMNYRRSAVAGERFDGYFSGYGYREDAEYSYRISKKGPVRMIPDARLWHNYSTGNRMNEAELHRMQIKNYHYVFRKFKHGAGATLLFGWSLFGIFILDLVEFLSRRDEAKWRKLKAGVAASFGLLGAS